MLDFLRTNLFYFRRNSLLTWNQVDFKNVTTIGSSKNHPIIQDQEQEQPYVTRPFVAYEGLVHETSKLKGAKEQKSGIKNLGVQTEKAQYKEGGTQTELSWEELILEDSIFKFKTC